MIFTYDTKHPDRLMAFGNDDIANYDSIGNPISYRGNTLTWKKGRQLSSIVTEKGATQSFTYDANGRRIDKSGKGEGTKYLYAGDTLIAEERYDKDNMLCFGDDLIAGDLRVVGNVSRYRIEYIYGQDGITGFKSDGKIYYYRRNIQGDIIAIYGLDGRLKVCYTYDAWGNHSAYDINGTEIYDSKTGIKYGYNGHIGNINPYRYRGYYFDTETGLYYLKTRYYDAETSRFINADDIAYIDPESINGLNLYAYCLNNPIMMTDETGNMPNWLKWLIGGIAFVGAVALTIVSGGALSPVIIGMGVSILAGGLIQGGINASNGGSFGQGFADGMADGVLWGGVFALGGAALRTAKLFMNGVTIGQTMDRVNGAARQIGAVTYKSPGKQLIKLFGGKNATNIMMNQNARWINRMVKWGVKITDIGVNALRPNSIFYAMEATATTGYWNLTKMFWPALL